MITRDIDGNKVVQFEFPETRMQLNSDGDLLISQSVWNIADERWEMGCVHIPKDFIDMFVNSLCDVAGVM